MTNGVNPISNHVGNLQPVENSKAKNSWTEQLKDYASSGSGIEGMAKCAYKVTALVAEIVNLSGDEASGDSMNSTSKEMKASVKGMVYPYLLTSTIKLGEQFSVVQADGAGSGRLLELTRRCFDWVSTASVSVFAYFLPTYKTALGHIGTATDLTAELIGAYQAADGWMQADQLDQEGISPDVQKGLKAEKSWHFITLVKAVLAVTALIFVGLAAIMCVALVEPVVLLAIAAAGAIFGVIKHFQKENLPFKPHTDWSVVQA